MKHLAVQACLLQEVPLPDIDGLTCGPIHTLVSDPDRNLYLSDEFNHRVISLDRKGKVRWVVGRQDGPGCRFRYPRGLALGWIRREEQASRSLAVCDSWNDRVLFLDLAGREVCSWNRCDSLQFREVVDARYISSTNAGGAEGYWLMLDRGNHRLIAADQHGRSLFTVGRCFPYDIGIGPTQDWLDPLEDSFLNGIVRDFPQSEPMYYPSRILGNSEESIAIWQPFRSSANQLFWGSLFNLELEKPEDAEFFAGDAERLLSWSRSAGRILCHDIKGDTTLDHPISGAPVASNLPTSKYWTQHQNVLGLWQWCDGLETEQTYSRFAQLQRLAALKFERAIQDPELRDSFLNLVEKSAAFLRAGNRYFELLADAERSNGSIQAIEDEALRLYSDQCHAASRVKAGSSKLQLACMICSMVQSAVEDAIDPVLLNKMNADLEPLCQPILNMFVKMQKQWDEIRSLIYPSTLRCAEELDPTQKAALTQRLVGLYRAMDLLQRWSGNYKPRSQLIASLADRSGCRDSAQQKASPIRLLRRPASTDMMRSKYLREVDRFTLRSGMVENPANPFGLAKNSKGDIYVTLSGVAQIVRLDSHGKVQHRIELEGLHGDQTPILAGIASDAQDRLWVTDFSNHRILIVNAESGEVERIIGHGSAGINFRCPSGVCRATDGNMLIADSANQRIVAIGPDGENKVLREGMGAGPGEFRFPVSICCDSRGEDCFIWVTDQQNHRIQRLTADGVFLQQYGSCGIGRGKLLLPMCVLPFSGRTIIVCQYWPNGGLKVFSEDGEELDHLPLDYEPAGILLQDDQLFVAENSGNHVRVYLRDSAL